MGWQTLPTRLVHAGSLTLTGYHVCMLQDLCIIEISTCRLQPLLTTPKNTICLPTMRLYIWSGCNRSGMSLMKLPQGQQCCVRLKKGRGEGQKTRDILLREKIGSARTTKSMSIIKRNVQRRAKSVQMKRMQQMHPPLELFHFFYPQLFVYQNNVNNFIPKYSHVSIFKIKLWSVA